MHNKLKKISSQPFHERFRKFAPVFIDLETTGTKAHLHGVVQIACVFLQQDELGLLDLGDTYCWDVKLAEGKKSTQESIKITGIDPSDPERFAYSEAEVIEFFFQVLKKHLAETKTKKAILGGHNVHFDLLFLEEMLNRHNHAEHNLFHYYSLIDTATLATTFVGNNVLYKACTKLGIHFNQKLAHSAAYDAQKSAALFCKLVNHFHLGSL